MKPLYAPTFKALSFGLSLWLVVSCLSFLPTGSYAQIRFGTIKGVVMDQTGAVLPGVRVTLENKVSRLSRSAITAEDGTFAFNNVPFDPYTLRAELDGFEPLGLDVHVHSNVPITLELKMKLKGITEMVVVESHKELIEEDSTRSHVDMDERFIETQAGAAPNLGISSLIATAPGFVIDDNSRLHVRGTESQILYVVDGIPIIDRLDRTFASSIDPSSISSIEILTGSIPAEFGNRLGGVVNLWSKSGIDIPLSGNFSFSAGNFRTGELSYSIGGKVANKLGFHLSTSTSQSERFLDPPDPRNFNNRGGAGKLNTKWDWQPTDGDIFHFNFSINGTDFRVPNRERQELAGQRQRQELRDNHQSIAWQHTWSKNTVTNFAAYRRFYRAQLRGSQFDTPIFAEQKRKHSHMGAIGSITHQRGGHILKAGFEVFRTPVREFFAFEITDPDEVAVTPEAAKFVKGNPFIFKDGRTGRQASAYIQDSFSPFKNFTLDAGLRYDNYRLLVLGHQLSPRIGAVYYMPRTKSAIRGSFNRFFQPPQIENLLLAGSPQAAKLSPFAEEGGSAEIRPDIQSVYEVGWAQDVGGVFKLDVAYYWRRISNFADRDQFLDTAIIFPISIARGRVQGLDVRLDLPERHGLSGYFSYSNSTAKGIGPLNGGLFLSEEFKAIKPGLVFPVDHDQRNTGGFGIVYRDHKRGWWVGFRGRYESGLPFEFDEEKLEELKGSPGADLVDFERRRVKPRTLLSFSAGVELFGDERVSLSLQFDVQNLTNERFLYNFESVFGGTHFGYPRLWSGRIKVSFR